MAAIQQRWTQLLSTLQVLTPLVVSLLVQFTQPHSIFRLPVSLVPVQYASLTACKRHCVSFWQRQFCCVQVWTSSACDLLPSSASVYASTANLFGFKSPLRRLDRVHWSLMSGLVVVSAVYLVREHSLSTRERRLRKELINSQAEISKLVMKVMFTRCAGCCVFLVG